MTKPEVYDELQVDGVDVTLKVQYFGEDRTPWYTAFFISGGNWIGRGKTPEKATASARSYIKRWKEENELLPALQEALRRHQTLAEHRQRNFSPLAHPVLPHDAVSLHMTALAYSRGRIRPVVVRKIGKSTSAKPYGVAYVTPSDPTRVTFVQVDRLWSVR